MYTIKDIEEFLELNKTLTAQYQNVIDEIDASEKGDRFPYDAHKRFLAGEIVCLAEASAELRKIHVKLLKEHVDRLEAICASAYQMAGTYDAPVRFLDALSFHDEYMEMTPDKIIEKLLPISTPNDGGPTSTPNHKPISISIGEPIYGFQMRPKGGDWTTHYSAYPSRFSAEMAAQYKDPPPDEWRVVEYRTWNITDKQ